MNFKNSSESGFGTLSSWLPHKQRTLPQKVGGQSSDSCAGTQDDVRQLISTQHLQARDMEGTHELVKTHAEVENVPLNLANCRSLPLTASVSVSRYFIIFVIYNSLNC